MLSSISPVGEHARGQPWWLTVSAHLVASAAAATLLGSLLGLLGSGLGVSGGAALGLLGLLGIAGLVVDRTAGVPTLHRQVDQRWLTTYRGWVYGAGFGAQLGVGVVTIIPSTVVYLLWAAALLTADPLRGGLVGLAFGVARALPLLAAGRIRTVPSLRRTMAAMEGWRHTASQATAIGQGALSLVAIGLALR